MKASIIPCVWCFSRRRFLRTTLSILANAVMLLIFIGEQGAAQIQERQRDPEDTRAGRLQAPTDALSSGVSGLISVPPMAGTVDPEHYVVGPSDVFSINIWTRPPLTFLLQISPEGSLIIPTVGEVDVAGITLAEAKKAVLDRINKVFLIGDPTMTLVRPRTVVVRVDGAVPTPGNHVHYATDRVDVAVRQTQGFAIPVSQRHIILRRKDGTVLRVDIPLFYATRNETLNPFLQEGDEIIVPELRREAGAIGIYGGVNKPGRHEYVPGDSLRTAIQLGFGLGYRADPDSILLTRLDSTGSNMSESYFSLKDLEEGIAPNLPLNPGDRIFVKERTELRTDYRVWVTGEVTNPGIYPITRNSTRLSEIIKRAGGVTPYAALRSSQIFRTTSHPAKNQQDYLLSYRGLVAPDDSVNYLAEAALRLRREMVTVDFEQAIVARDSSSDLMLQSEDSIVVATALNTVYVFGQVRKPGHVSLRPGQDVDYYVDQAGGLTEHAKGGDIMIIKRTTGQALEAGEGTIEDGDYVWVPLSPDRPLGYHLGIAAQAAAIVTAATSLIFLIFATR